MPPAGSSDALLSRIASGDLLGPDIPVRQSIPEVNGAISSHPLDRRVR